MKLIWLVCLALCAQIRALPLEQLVEELSESVGARTNVFFGFKRDYAAQDIIRKSSLPKLLITEHPNFELRQSFSSEIVSVVLVEQTGFDGLLDIVKATLNRLYKTDVLFVTEGHINDMQQWSWLFRWCWETGFYNVLLTDANGSLVTFEPFPHLQVIGTTLEKYIQQRNNWRDLKGYPIRVGLGNNPPRALVHKTQNKDLIISGNIPLNLNAFIRRYNASFVPVLMPHFEAYSVLECLNCLKNGTVDVCADGIPMSETIVTSRSHEIYYGFLIVPAAQPINKFRYFLTPFSTNLWLIIGLTICYITLMTSLIYWRQSGAWNIGKFFLQSVSSILYLGFDISTIRGYYIIHLILIVAGFILSNLYLALLSSVLTTDVFGRQISSLEEIRDRNLTILVTEFDMIGLRSFNASNVMVQQTQVVSEEILFEHRNNLDTNYIYYCLTDKCNMYLYQQKFLLRPRMTLLEQPILALWGSIPIQSNWHFEEYFNLHDLQLTESGLEQHYQKTAWEDAIVNDEIKFFKTEYYDVLPLSIEYFQMPAILLGVGYLAALITFIAENIYARYSRRRVLARNIV